MNKLLVIYNTCGIYGRDNTGQYEESLNSILNQDLEGCKVALSSCLNNPFHIDTLQKTFEGRVNFNIINEQLPVNVTFNQTVNKYVKEFGEFEGYVFVDSGITLGSDPTILTQLYDLFKSGPYGMVSARTDDDMGFDQWYKTDMLGQKLFDNHLIIDVGMAVNLHVQIFGNSILKHYGGLMPDIFAGQCTESVFSFLCAALKQKWVVHKDVVLKHYTGMDGASSGFEPHRWQAEGRNRWDHLFGTEESILDIVRRGIEYGMGYEEVQKIVLHNPDKFDKDGFALDDRLKDYIRDELFLQ